MATVLVIPAARARCSPGNGSSSAAKRRDVEFLTDDLGGFLDQVLATMGVGAA